VPVVLMSQQEGFEIPADAEPGQEEDLETF
jgi:hypothetical protein